MSVRLTSSILKTLSLSGAVFLTGMTLVSAQEDTSTAPQLPASPITDAAPQQVPSTTNSQGTAAPPSRPQSLGTPAADETLTDDSTSIPRPVADIDDTGALSGQPVAVSDQESPVAIEPSVQTDETTDETPTAAPIVTPQSTTEQVEAAAKRAATFLQDGGPSIWAIASLSVITVALILWKIWRLALIGAWARGKAQKAVTLYEDGNTDAALELISRRKGLRSKVVNAAITARETLTENAAREETSRVAKRELGDAAVGLRALELIATIAPLLGLLGTVLGMIAAFQALQESGSRADPSLLAGGIWEALLTTAAGMAVAIPTSAALTWFEAVIDRMRRDIEDAAMRIFVTRKEMEVRDVPALAAE